MKRLIVSGIAALALTVGVATASAGLGVSGDAGGWGGEGCPPAGVGAPCRIDDTSGTTGAGSTVESTIGVVGSELTPVATPHVDTSTDPHALVVIGSIEPSGEVSGAGEVDLTEDGTCPPAGSGPCTIG